MDDLNFLEECYNKYRTHLHSLLPDSVYIVDIHFLQQLNLLNFMPGHSPPFSTFHQRFQAIESPQKITLISDQFVVWIVPQIREQTPSTLLIIALAQANLEPCLEAAIIASGIYNQSKLVLKILEKFLSEIEENNALLAHFKDPHI